MMQDTSFEGESGKNLLPFTGIPYFLKFILWFFMTLIATTGV